MQALISKIGFLLAYLPLGVQKFVRDMLTTSDNKTYCAFRFGVLAVILGMLGALLYLVATHQAVNFLEFGGGCSGVLALGGHAASKNDTPSAAPAGDSQ